MMMEYYNELKAGREITIVGRGHENTAVFWMDGGNIVTWTRELGTFTRDKDEMPPERFEQHCRTCEEDGCGVFLRG